MRVTQAELVSLAGARVRLWDFSPSHDRLVLQITPLLGSNIYLVLSGCEHITTPVVWVVGTPRLEVSPPFIEVTDGGVCIRCQDASIHPHYSRSL